MSSLFAPDTLSSSALPDRSIQIGEGAATPEVLAIAEGSGGGAVGASSGEAVWERRLSPSQRDAVSEFFGVTEE